MANQSRRKFLKGLSYGGILAVGGMTTASYAFSGKPAELVSASIAAPSINAISIMQQQSNGKEMVTVMNNTDRTINLEGNNPIALERVNGSIVVKVNTTPEDEGAIAVLPNGRFSFDIEEVSANIINNSQPVGKLFADQLMISSEHSAFNQILAVA